MKSWVIGNELARRAAIEFIRTMPLGDKVLIRPAKQSDIQVEKYHAMIGDIAKHEPHFTPEVWKRLLVDQFKADTLGLEFPKLREYWLREKIEMRPSLDGQRLVVLGEQTRVFPKYVSSAFIEFLYAWGGDKGVRWTNHQ